MSWEITVTRKKSDDEDNKKESSGSGGGHDSDRTIRDHTDEPAGYRSAGYYSDRERVPWGQVLGLLALVMLIGGVVTALVIWSPAGTTSTTDRPSTSPGPTAVGNKICAKGKDDKADNRMCLCPEGAKGKSCVQMVRVDEGNFRMGTDINAIREETPELFEEFADAQHRHGVTIQKPFWVSQFEITFDQWDACYFDRDKTKVDQNGNPESGCWHQPPDNGWGRGDRPVINVSWNDAKVYLEWLSQETGRDLRLLTESEWEYMARGGHNGPFQHISYAFTDDLGELIPFNEFGEPSTFHANFQPRHVETERRCEYRRQTVPQYFTNAPNIADQEANCANVETSGRLFFPYINNANPIGVHFVHGNVWEWVQDCYFASYVGAPLDGSAREADIGKDCEKRVLRGGSWGSSSHQIRVDYRNNRSPDVTSNAVGFRIAWTEGDCVGGPCKTAGSLLDRLRGGRSGNARTSSSDEDDELWED